MVSIGSLTLRCATQRLNSRIVWYNITSDSTHTLFLDLFRNLGLSQLIHTSTYKHNNILDILLSDSPNMLDSLCIHEPGSFLNSDHSPITFNIKSVIHISKPIKRTIYNYKKQTGMHLTMIYLELIGNFY